MLELGGKPDEQLMEENANSVVYTERGGVTRLPYYDAMDVMLDIKGHGMPGGCAESAAAFLFGRELVEGLGLMPDFTDGNPSEDERVLKVRELVESNYFELSRHQGSYRPPIKVSYRNIARDLDVLRDPHVKKFMLCSVGDFPNASLPEGHGITGHMIGGVRGDLSNLPPEMVNMRPGPGVSESPYWLWDANDFGVYHPGSRTKEKVIKSNLSYPPGLRLVSTLPIKQLASLYSLPDYETSLKIFYE